MINPYCGALDGLFAELVYYGILKEEDAQCFRADVSVEPTFYVLFCAALVLVLINTFVMKAVSQYRREMDRKMKLYHYNHKAEDLDDLRAHEIEGSSDSSATSTSIHPAPVLFTDRFRWLLYREDVHLSRTSTRSFGSGSIPKQPLSASTNASGDESENAFADSTPSAKGEIARDGDESDVDMEGQSGAYSDSNDIVTLSSVSRDGRINC
jgi:hypothetical protein